MSTKQYLEWKRNLKNKLRDIKKRQDECLDHEWEEVRGIGCPGFKLVTLVLCRKCKKLKKEADRER